MVSRKGFSLIEVLVFTAILGLFFVASMAVATFNLKNMKIQEHKILATRFAEEGIEWVKQEKEDDWPIFITRGSAGGKTYCLNSLNWNTSVNCGEVYALGTPGFFKRELLITNSGSPINQVEATVTVYWQDMGTVLSVPIKTVFKLLE
ncbi:type II secretion system protein [Candidatus Roizmanbacteria bacterium]|nr:type II secretion system protein [Candidatus Roizmanbacteria bacterium]